jgi:hypothetical protein
MLLGILVGGWAQGKLPEGHQSSDSKEVVKLSLGIMGTLAALVLQAVSHWKCSLIS